MSNFTKFINPDDTEKQNKHFHALSKRKQRLAIAADVLSQLKAKKYKAKRGTYHHSDDLDFELFRMMTSESAHLLQSTLLSKEVSCTVCGLGAAFCSLSRLGNNIHWQDREHDVLLPLFGREQLELIEHAFEGMDINEDEHLTGKQARRAEKFYNKHSNKNKRLAAIFKNIIKNDGTFEP